MKAWFWCICNRLISKHYLTITKIFNKPAMVSWLEQRFSDFCFFKFSFDSWFSESSLINQVLFTKSRIDCRSKMGRSQSQFKRLILPKQSEFLSRATIYVLCHASFEASQKNAITSSKLLSFFFWPAFIFLSKHFTTKIGKIYVDICKKIINFAFYFMTRKMWLFKHMTEPK